MKTYQVIARAIGARNRCEQTGNIEWQNRWQARIAELVADFPSGSGFNNGTQLDDSSTSEKLVFNTAFHHMDENGYYDGWTEHQVIVKPSLEMGFSLTITGRDRNEIKEYIAECFMAVLSNDAPEFKTEQAIA